MTLSMDGSWTPYEESAAPLSPCHIQISPPSAAFCGSRAVPGSTMPMSSWLWIK
jgi:hypothetical protein